METTMATVVFLRKEGKLCLARKKKPIHNEAGEISYSLKMWNGYGGKAEPEDVTVAHTAIRELYDESSVRADVVDLIPAGHVLFFWEGNTGRVANMDVSFYFLDLFVGDPLESDEMGPPEWFAPDEIPYGEMMGGDKLLLPRMITGECVSGKLYLGELTSEDLPRFVEKEI